MSPSASRPSCFVPPAYDPIGPLRSPLSRRTIEACTADMTSVMEEIARCNDGTVTKDDLHRAGFTNGEIDACHAEACSALTERLRPRQIRRAA